MLPELEENDRRRWCDICGQISTDPADDYECPYCYRDHNGCCYDETHACCKPCAVKEAAYPARLREVEHHDA